MDMKLEVVVVPVADVDRAKDFYESLGWRLDADFSGDGGFRVVQLTPPGSACSIIFGRGVTAAAAGLRRGPAARRQRYRAARADLVGRGVEVSEVFHDGWGVPPCRYRGTCSGSRPRSARRTGPSRRSMIRTATPGSSRR